MKLLLDTHVLLWWLDEPTQLSSVAQVAIADTANDVLVSAAVVWEIVIKSSLGKLTIPADLDQVIHQSGFHSLPIESTHALATRQLPQHHRDPFDLILAAQAVVENATLVTRDARILQYPVSTMRA